MPDPNTKPDDPAEPIAQAGASGPMNNPASPPPSPPPRTHAATCAAVVRELEGHAAYLRRLLAELTEATADAASRGRHSAAADLARAAVSVQAGAARCLAGILSVSTEGAIASAALGRGGPRGPLLDAPDVDAE